MIELYFTRGRLNKRASKQRTSGQQKMERSEEWASRGLSSKGQAVREDIFVLFPPHGPYFFTVSLSSSAFGNELVL